MMVSITGQLDLRYVPFVELVDPQTLVTVVRYIPARQRLPSARAIPRSVARSRKLRPDAKRTDDQSRRTEQAVSAARLSRVVGGRDVSFSVSDGEIYGLLGPNGAGKTTDSRMILGLLPATSGYATIDGFRSSEQPDEVRRASGSSPANAGVSAWLTVEEMLLYFADLYDVPHERPPSNSKRSPTCSIFVRCSTGGALYAQHRAEATGQPRPSRPIHDPPIMLLDEPTLGSMCSRRKSSPTTSSTCARAGQGGHHHHAPSRRGGAAVLALWAAAEDGSSPRNARRTLHALLGEKSLVEGVPQVPARGVARAGEAPRAWKTRSFTRQRSFSRILEHEVAELRLHPFRHRPAASSSAPQRSGVIRIAHDGPHVPGAAAEAASSSQGIASSTAQRSGLSRAATNQAGFRDASPQQSSAVHPRESTVNRYDVTQSRSTSRIDLHAVVGRQIGVSRVRGPGDAG